MPKKMKTFEVTLTDYEYSLIKKCLKYERLVLDNPITFKDFVHDTFVDGLSFVCVIDDVAFPPYGGDYE